MSLTRMFGLGFAIIGGIGGIWLFFGNLADVFTALNGTQLFFISGGGFLALVAVGILMMVGETESRHH